MILKILNDLKHGKTMVVKAISDPKFVSGLKIFQGTGPRSQTVM